MIPGQARNVVGCVQDDILENKNDTKERHIEKGFIVKEKGISATAACLPFD